jgi:Arylsulfotransferase (ASST)
VPAPIQRAPGSGFTVWQRRPMLGWAAALGLAGEIALAAPTGAGAAPSAPTCTPATLNRSALLARSVTVSPLPGSRDASPQTQISFLGVPARGLGRVSVVGSKTGAHSGRLLAYSQGNGASFMPSRPFVAGERVSVYVRLRVRAAVHRLHYRFAIADQDSISSTPEAIHPGGELVVQSFRSRPDLRPPTVTVTAQSPAAAAGEEFVAPYAGPGQAGPMILDARGGLVWFKALPTYTSAANFQVQEYHRKPVLTWWQGVVSVHGFGRGQDVIADGTYSDIAHVKAGNGYQADLHEFQLTPRGTALITAYDPILCDLSSVGGAAKGAVTDGLIQEIDVKTGLVMLQWTSIDHVGLGESYEHARNSTTSVPFDFFHVNSIDLERDGSLLVSARNTWTSYEIDGRTGKIAWRLGGRHSSFALAPGTGIAWQHDPRQLADGSISIFDNGASPPVHRQSRGVVLSLNSRRRTATVLSQITHPSRLRADSQGNMQALANGDWFLGWGQVPDFSEFSAAGQLLFDAHLPAHDQSYRSFRFAWSGTPAHLPAFAVDPAPGGLGTVYASWNGATLVAGWRVLVGPTSSSLRPVAQAARSGFETAIALPPGTAGPYVAVQALDASGAVIATARTTKA